VWLGVLCGIWSSPVAAHEVTSFVENALSHAWHLCCIALVVAAQNVSSHLDRNTSNVFFTIVILSTIRTVWDVGHPISRRSGSRAGRCAIVFLVAKFACNSTNVTLISNMVKTGGTAGGGGLKQYALGNVRVGTLSEGKSVGTWLCGTWGIPSVAGWSPVLVAAR
jgi:hypothetical protein